VKVTTEDSYFVLDRGQDSSTEMETGPRRSCRIAVPVSYSWNFNGEMIT